MEAFMSCNGPVVECLHGEISEDNSSRYNLARRMLSILMLSHRVSVEASLAL